MITSCTACISGLASQRAYEIDMIHTVTLYSCSTTAKVKLLEEIDHRSGPMIESIGGDQEVA